MTATARTPTFVLVEGDVWVIEDYDEPIFYTDGLYWRFSGGVWYRSHAYNEGWVTITVVPDAIRRIDRPTRYVHYIAPPEAQRHVGPPGHAPARGVRGTPPGHEEAPPAAPPPDRGPPAEAGGGPPPEHGPPAAGPPPGHGPPDDKGAEAKPDRADDKGKAEKSDRGKEKGKGKGGKKK